MTIVVDWEVEHQIKQTKVCRAKNTKDLID